MQSGRSKCTFLVDVGYSLCGGWFRFAIALAALVVTLPSFSNTVSCYQVGDVGAWICQGTTGSIQIDFTGGVSPGGGSEDDSNTCTNCVQMTPAQCISIKEGIIRSSADLQLTLGGLISSATNSIDKVKLDEITSSIDTSINDLGYMVNDVDGELRYVRDFTASKIQEQLSIDLWFLRDHANTIKEVSDTIKAFDFKSPDQECNISLSSDGVIDYTQASGSSLYWKEQSVKGCLASLPQSSYSSSVTGFTSLNGSRAGINEAYTIFTQYSSSRSLYDFYTSYLKPLSDRLDGAYFDLTARADGYEDISWMLGDYNPTIQGTPRYAEYIAITNRLAETKILVNNLPLAGLDDSSISDLSTLVAGVTSKANEMNCEQCNATPPPSGSPVCSLDDLSGCGDFIRDLASTLKNVESMEEEILRIARSSTNSLDKIVLDYLQVYSNNFVVVTNTLTRLDDHVIDDYIKANSNLVSSITEVREHWSSPVTPGGSDLNGGGELGGSGIGQISLQEYSKYTPLERIELNLLRLSDLLLPSEDTTTATEKGILDSIKTLQENKLNVQTSLDTIFANVNNTQSLQTSADSIKGALEGLVNTFSSVFSNYNDPRSAEITLTPDISVEGDSSLTFPSVKINTTEIKPAFEYLRSATTLLVQLVFIFIYLAFGRWLVGWIIPLLSKILDLYNSFTS